MEGKEVFELLKDQLKSLLLRFISETNIDYKWIFPILEEAIPELRTLLLENKDIDTVIHLLYDLNIESLKISRKVALEKYLGERK